MSKSIAVSAVNIFNQAIAAENAGDEAMAYQLLIGALAEDPNLACAWHNLGAFLTRRRLWNSAAAAFARAHEFGPDNVQVQANYAWALHMSGRDDAALPLIQSAIDKETSNPQYWVNFSQVLLSCDELSKAYDAAKNAVQIRSDEPQSRLALALAALRLGDYQNGLREYENRMPYIPELQQMMNYPYPLWRGEDLKDKTIFIPCEQGLGDSVMFLRFIPLVISRAKKVIIHCHDSCLKHFKYNIAQKCGLTGVEIFPIPKELPGSADYFCPLLSLPVALNMSTEDILNAFWLHKTKDSPIAKLKNKINIGICWAGDPKHDNDKHRSAKLEDFLSLAEIPNSQLYSLQLGARRKDLDDVGTHAIIRDIGGYIKDALDTAGIAKQTLDYVVSVDTAPVHIAGSVGCKVFALIGDKGVDWRWQTGTGQSCWYPNVALVRARKGYSDAVKQVRDIISGLA